MVREVYHPNAYLVDFRNVKLGLQARTRVLNALEMISADAKTIAKQAGLNYRVVMHHLKLLEARGLVQRKGRRRSVWKLTGLGQKTLQWSTSH
jgi:predicted transcriptional regulator